MRCIIDYCLFLQTLMMQLPRLLDRLDEIGLRRVDGEVLWSQIVTNQAPQDQAGLQTLPSVFCSSIEGQWKI